MKRHSKLLVIRENQIKTKVKIPLHSHYYGYYRKTENRTKRVQNGGLAKRYAYCIPGSHQNYK